MEGGDADDDSDVEGGEDGEERGKKARRDSTSEEMGTESEFSLQSKEQSNKKIIKLN